MDARSGDAFLIAVTACALVSYYLLIHDLSIMLIPVAVSLDRNIAAEATGHHPGRLMARAAALMFVAPVWRIFHSFPFLYSGAAVVHLFLRLVTDWAVQELIPRSPEARSITLSICGPRKTTQTTLSYSRNKFQ